MSHIGRACFALSVVFSAVLPQAFATGGSAEFRQLYLNRLARLHSIIVSFRQESFYNPVSQADSAAVVAKIGKAVHFRTGLYVERGEFSFLDGIALYDTSYAPETVKRFEADRTVFLRREIQAFSRDRAETFVHHSQTGNLAGAVRDRQKLPDDYPIDVALGLRCVFEQAWLDGARLKDAEFTTMPDGHLVMRLGRSDRPDVSFRWELDPALGDAVVRFQGSKGKFVFYDLTCSELEKSSGLGLPGRVTVAYPAKRIVLRNLKYNLNAHENTPARYHIQYPSGSHVTDMRLDVAMSAPTTRAFSDRDIYLAAVAHDSQSRAIPARSGLTRWWIVAGMALFIVLVLSGYQWRRRQRGSRGVK